MHGTLWTIRPVVKAGRIVLGQSVQNTKNGGMKKLLEKFLGDEAHPASVAPRITALRESLSMSKAEFARAVGIDQSSLTKIERGTKGIEPWVVSRIRRLYGFNHAFIYAEDFSGVPEELRARTLVELATAKARAAHSDPASRN